MTIAVQLAGIYYPSDDLAIHLSHTIILAMVFQTRPSFKLYINIRSTSLSRRRVVLTDWNYM